MVLTISQSVNSNVPADPVKFENGRVWWQWTLCIIAYLPFLTNGLQATHLCSLPLDRIPRLLGVPWTASAHVLAGLLAAPVLCWAADRFGRRVGAWFVCAVQAISWILLLSKPIPEVLIASNALTGVASAGIFTVLPIYVRETGSDGATRPVTLSLFMMMMILGQLVMNIMRVVMEKAVIEYAVMGFVVLQFLLMFFLVETPSFCVMRGSVEAAKINLGKLKCLSQDAVIIDKEVHLLQEESERAKAFGTLSFRRILQNAIWRDATKIGLVLQTIAVLGGRHLYLNHRRLLEASGVEVDEGASDLTVSAAMLAGSAACLALIGFWEPKYILTLSLATTALSLGVSGVFLQEGLSPAAPPPLQLGAMLAVAAAHGLGWGLPWVVVCEMVNLEIRATLIGFLYVYAAILHFAHVHTFQDIEDYVGVYSLCYIFALANILGGVYALFLVPETRRQTPRMIERKLKRRPILKL
ncbi:hypothetical protein JYU34_015475 [Plutella xylostella]|uniref:Facilitated trehalose transporter Tret1 n=1 Tax=Plutella xylostella TaxID=51655 RepID=A0ABQ7Q769_PLUXY|nr:hypothetical protein JYU34_015475 [Plutella xylostella]